MQHRAEQQLLTRETRLQLQQRARRLRRHKTSTVSSQLLDTRAGGLCSSRSDEKIILVIARCGRLRRQDRQTARILTAFQPCARGRYGVLNRTIISTAKETWRRGAVRSSCDGKPGISCFRGQFWYLGILGLVNHAHAASTQLFHFMSKTVAAAMMLPR